MNKLGENLIFLISLPRSGSTMLQRILAGHPDIQTAPEPWIMLHPLYALKQNGIHTVYEAPLAKQATDAFLSERGGEETYLDAIRAMASVLYGKSLHESGKKYFLDKTPRYYYVIPELQRTFPEARFIFLFRNPLSVLSSMLSTWFGNNLEFFIKSYNYADILNGPELLMQGSHLKTKYSATLAYETLVSTPAVCIKDLCSKLDLQFHKNMLEYGNTTLDASQFGDQVGINIHKRPNANTTNKWQKNMARKELVDFSRQYLDKLGKNIVVQSGYDFRLLNQQLDKITY